MKAPVCLLQLLGGPFDTDWWWMPSDSEGSVGNDDGGNAVDAESYSSDNERAAVGIEGYGSLSPDADVVTTRASVSGSHAGRVGGEGGKAGEVPGVLGSRRLSNSERWEGGTEPWRRGLQRMVDDNSPSVGTLETV